MGSRYPWISRWPVLAAAVVAALGLLAGLSTIGAAPSGSKTLVILYSNQAYGQIRSCNCTKFRYGGYGREATLVEKIRKEDPNVVIIEGGDAVGSDQIEQDKLKSSVAIKAMDVIGYSAFVFGDAELRYDRKSVESWAGKTKTPLILANAKYKDTEKPVCSQPYVIRKMPNGLRVAIVGVVGVELFPDMAQLSLAVKVSDPEAALKSLLPKIRTQADFIVVTAHAEAKKARELAKLSGVDMVLCTHTFDKLEMPAKDKNIVEGSVEKVGKCTFVESGVRSGWSIGRLDLELSGKTVKTMQNRVFFLDRAYEEHPSVVKLYDEYNAKVTEIINSQQNELKDKFASLLKERGIDPSKRAQRKTFAGAAACKACHEDAYNVWAKTRHASAFASLTKTGQGADPECTGCHTTGATQRGGFVSSKDTPDLINVQCESCHGGRASHADKPTAGVSAVPEDLCRSCHTEAYNPDFDYEQMVSRIRHKKQQANP